MSNSGSLQRPLPPLSEDFPLKHRPAHQPEPPAKPDPGRQGGLQVGRGAKAYRPQPHPPRQSPGRRAASAGQVAGRNQPASGVDGSVARSAVSLFAEPALGSAVGAAHQTPLSMDRRPRSPADWPPSTAFQHFPTFVSFFSVSSGVNPPIFPQARPPHLHTA